MYCIRFFQIIKNKIIELEGKSVQIEKSLQMLIESNLETFLGVRLLGSEYSTCPKHGGRLGTIGTDEDNCSVIIEYKRAINDLKNICHPGVGNFEIRLNTPDDFERAKPLIIKRYEVN